MKNNRIFKSILFILALLIVCVIVFFLYYRFTGKENPINTIFNNDKKSNIFDNYNGFYVYTDELNKTYNIYNGCLVKNFDYQIVVMGDKYKLYKESCIGTYYIESGKTEDLDFQVDEENKMIYFDYEDHRYFKKNEINSLVLGNTFLKNTKKLNLSSYKFLIEQSEFEGNYYNIDEYVIDGALKYKFSLKTIDGGAFQIKLISGATRIFESNIYTDISKMPDIYPFDKIIALVFPIKGSKEYKYGLKAYNEKGEIFDIYHKFPMKVNDYQITEEDNFYISYQQSSRSFIILIAPKNSNLKNVFCEEGKESNNIAYYVFSLKYDYSKINFGEPQFERIGYVKDGCGYVNSIMGG